jgi:hypothetical protein
MRFRFHLTSPKTLLCVQANACTGPGPWLVVAAGGALVGAVHTGHNVYWSKQCL